MTDTITLPGKGDAVPEVRQKLAWRVLIGRFIARWVETFAGLAGAQIVAIIALPPSQFSFSVFLQLVRASRYQAAAAMSTPMPDDRLHFR